MKTIELQLETLGCPSCGVKIERALMKIKGVEEVKVLFNASKVKVLGNVDSDSLIDTVEKLGYSVLSTN